jgi:hypothetical protein
MTHVVKISSSLTVKLVKLDGMFELKFFETLKGIL